jgi:predicted PurR-regulated permease PerM
MEKIKISNSNIVFAVVLISALILAFYARYVILSALIGIGIGVLLSPIFSYFLKKIRLPKAITAMLVLICFVLISGLVLGSLYYIAADQAESLSQRAPLIVASLDSWVASMFDRYPWMKEQANNFNFGTSLSNWAMSLFKGFRTGFMAISGAFFAFIIGLYTAIDGTYLYDRTVEAFVPRLRDKSRLVMQDCARVLRGWFNAQLVDMGIIGTLTALGLWIAGVEYWAIFGLLTALLGIIPYVGIILVVITATLITLASEPAKVPWVIGVFLITQQLEGNLILPLVMKGKVELPVVPLLIFMLFLGNFFGVLGVFLAPPLFAVLRSLYINIYLPYLLETESIG